MDRRFLTATLALGLITVACANSSSGSGAGSGAGIAYPSDPAQLVVRIDSGGGFIAPSYSLTELPQFTLMGDGTAITPGAIPEIYPGPAIAPLFGQQLTPDAVQAILALAQADGLIGANQRYVDMGSVGIADAPSTTITIVANGSMHTSTFYALAELGQKKPPSMPQSEFDARTKAGEFTKKLGDLSWLPAGSASAPSPFTPSGVRVYVSAYQADPSLTEPAIAWPLSTGLATFGDPMNGAASGSALNTSSGLPDRCGAITGPDLATLLPLITKANQLTPWKSGGKEFGLLFRPLLPDESGC